MRRSSAFVLLIVLAITGLLTQTAGASPTVPVDDSEPPVLGPPPEYSGVDLAVRAANASTFAGPLNAPLRSTGSAVVTPPAGFHGTDLVITSIRSHVGACAFDPDGPWYTGACRDGRFMHDKGQAVIQPLADLDGSKAVARVGVWNFQPRARRITLKAAGSTRGYRVRYVVRHHDVTSRIVAGTYRTPRIAPGTVLPLRVVVTTRRFVANGKLTDFFVRAKRKVLTTSSGAEVVIPGDVVTDRVASAAYDAVPPIFPPPPA